MEFYPALPADAIGAGCDARRVPAGMVAVRPADLRRPGVGGSSALVAGTGAVRAGEDLVFCHQVAVAPAVVRRGGDVQAGGWLPGHVTLGVLEACLPVGEIEELVEDFGCRERRQRLLSAAMAVRVLIAAALIPDGDTTEVMHRVAGLLELLPWARPWHAPGAEALTRRLDLIPAELFEALFWRVAGPVASPDQPGMTWRGFLVCALDGFQVAVPDTDENRAYFGVLYPAAELAGLYPRRWGAPETTIGQDKSAITGAGPSRGPILRSGTPHQVTQEMWAWITATHLLRIHGTRAAAGQYACEPRVTPAQPPAPDRVPFTLTRREAVRAMTQTLAPATLPGALAAAAERASRRILASLIPTRPPRHRERRMHQRQERG